MFPASQSNSIPSATIELYCKVYTLSIWEYSRRRSSCYPEECPDPSGIAREAMKKYAAVIERGPNNLSAYVPDLPGCITTGGTVEEIARNIREAIEFHLEGLAEDASPIPEPGTVGQAFSLSTPSPHWKLTLPAAANRQPALQRQTSRCETGSPI